MANYILVGSYSNDVTTLVFDPTTKTLQVASSITVGHRPSWIASHIAHSSLVWTGLEQSEGKILALSYDERGDCEVVSESLSAGSDPCFLWADKHELVIANVRSTLSLILVLTSILYVVFIGNYRHSTDISRYPTNHGISPVHPASRFRARQIETTKLSSSSSCRI